MPVLTFLDANVLIAAHRGQTPDKKLAAAILRDPDRAFIASPFLRLELLPKAIYHRRAEEAAFYRAYLEDQARIWISDLDAIVDLATTESEKCGIAAMDGLHLAAASLAGAEVFYTLERREKPLFRSSLVKVVCLEASPNTAAEA